MLLTLIGSYFQKNISARDYAVYHERCELVARIDKVRNCREYNSIKPIEISLFLCNIGQLYEGHPINRENFLIMQEFVPLEHGKCNHWMA